MRPDRLLLPCVLVCACVDKAGLPLPAVDAGWDISERPSEVRIPDFVDAGPEAEAPTPDAAPEPMPDRPPDKPTMDECDPVSSYCPTGMQCVYACPDRLFLCVTEEKCGAAKCAPGSMCSNASCKICGDRCRRFCKTNADCPGGSICTTMGPSCIGEAGRVSFCS